MTADLRTIALNGFRVHIRPEEFHGIHRRATRQQRSGSASSRSRRCLEPVVEPRDRLWPASRGEHQAAGFGRDEAGGQRAPRVRRERDQHRAAQGGSPLQGVQEPPVYLPRQQGRVRIGDPAEAAERASRPERVHNPAALRAGSEGGRSRQRALHRLVRHALHSLRNRHRVARPRCGRGDPRRA